MKCPKCSKEIDVVFAYDTALFEGKLNDDGELVSLEQIHSRWIPDVFVCSECDEEIKISISKEFTWVV